MIVKFRKLLDQGGGCGAPAEGFWMLTSWLSYSQTTYSWFKYVVPKTNPFLLNQKKRKSQN